MELLKRTASDLHKKKIWTDEIHAFLTIIGFWLQH